MKSKCFDLMRSRKVSCFSQPKSTPQRKITRVTRMAENNEAVTPMSSVMAKPLMALVPK